MNEDLDAVLAKNGEKPMAAENLHCGNYCHRPMRDGVFGQAIFMKEIALALGI